MEILFINIFYIILLLSLFFQLKFNKKNNDKKIFELDIEIIHLMFDNISTLYKLKRKMEGDSSFNSLILYLDRLNDLGYFNFNENEKFIKKIFEIKNLLISLNLFTENDENFITKTTEKWKQLYLKM